MKFDAHVEALYQELPFAERFAAAKKDGFKYIEIWDWDNKDLDELTRLCAENELAIAAMSGDKLYDMCNPDDDEKYIAEVIESIRVAEKIGAQSVVIHSNELTPAGPVKNEHKDLSDTVKMCSMFRKLRALAPYAEEYDVQLVVEPLNIVTDHMGNYLTSTQQTAELLEAVNCPNIKMLYDVYHMYLNEGKLCETLDKYVSYIGHIHIADAPGRHEPGTGAINYANLFRHLDKLGYDGTVGCELFALKDTATAIAAVKDAAGDLF